MRICHDLEYIKEFMLKPEVYRYAAEYGNETREFIDDEKQCWIDYNGIGLINIEIKTGCMIEMHPYILREYKDKYKDMILELFKRIKERMPEEVQKINAVIPEAYKNTCAIAEEAGMTKEGVDRSSYRHENGICDRILYGITRSEL